MIVTKIEACENKKCKIYLNDAPAFELYKSEIKSCNLTEGMEIEDDFQDKILYEIVGKRAKKRAMHILQKHDKTEQQLRDKLLENRYPIQAVEHAIAYVKSYGYIDDVSYARRYIEYRSSRKSRKQLRMELYSKGISSEIISQVMEESRDGEIDVIKALILKKSASLHTMDEEAKRKLKNSLMRKGFVYTEIDRAFSQLESLIHS